MAEDRAQDQQTPVDPQAAGYLPVRRRPDLKSFLVSGALIGFVVGGIVGFLGPDAPGSSQTQEVILLGLVGVLVFGFLAAIAYLVADRRSQNR